MKFKFIQAAVVGLMLSVCSVANAGLIEADIYGDGSNKGYTIQGSDLEWIDFGEINDKSYDYVITQLGSSGVYAGWRLPSITEVYTMWNAAFYKYKGQVDSYKPNNNTYADFSMQDSGALFEDAVTILGSNSFDGFTHDSWGLFQGVNGLAAVIYSVELGDNINNLDSVSIEDSGILDMSGYGGYTGTMSTLLVRAATVIQPSQPTNSVPEPSTLAIFALGLMGLASRRFKKQS
jgi:hypothetical protein